jgi:hypothetical protein
MLIKNYTHQEETASRIKVDGRRTDWAKNTKDRI